MWVLNDGESVELIVGAVEPVGRITETRWITLVLWVDPHVTPQARAVGELDQAAEGAFVKAENDDPDFFEWKRIV